MVIVWAILIFLVLLILWLLIARFTVEVDTRVPYMNFQWAGFIKGIIVYRDKWVAELQILFFHTTLPIPFKRKKKQKKPKEKKRGKGSMTLSKALHKGKRVLRSFTVEKWELAVDTGDHTLNAKLYPVNYWKPCYRHLFINFHGDNYFYLKVHNRPWKLLYAFFG